MCLSPIRIVNPTKRLSSFGGQRAVIYVPCGHCADCKAQGALEWYSRSYYQTKGTIEQGGFVYFDTLTYDNKNLPWTKDVLGIDDEDLNFPCFNRDHFRTFLHSIRTHYNRLLGKGKFKLEYFLTSEYGLNPGDGKTFRPHYHVMFYIFGDINPIDFSYQVAKYWHYGRTDGGHYKTDEYILNHVFGKGYKTNLRDVLAVCSYVSKYIMKDSDFEETIQLRMAKLRAFEDIRCSYSKFAQMKSDYRKIKNCIDQFHRQSQGFGAYLLQDPTVDWKKVLSTCRVILPDHDNVTKEVPLCGYYMNKLCYVKGDDKKLHLSDIGIEIRKNRMINVVLPGQVEQFKLMFETMCNKEQQSTILDMLQGRSFRDYCIYQLLYRGFTRMNLQENATQIVEPGTIARGMTPTELNVNSWLNFIYRNTTEYEPCIYHYSTVPDKKRFGGQAFYTTEYLGDNDNGYKDEIPLMADNYGFDDHLDKFKGTFTYKLQKCKVSKVCVKYYGNCLDQETWIGRHVINQNSDYKFRRFDDLAAYISKNILSPVGEAKEKAFKEELALKKRMKVASGRFS